MPSKRLKPTAGTIGAPPRQRRDLPTRIALVRVDVSSGPYAALLAISGGHLPVLPVCLLSRRCKPQEARTRDDRQLIWRQ